MRIRYKMSTTRWYHVVFQNYGAQDPPWGLLPPTYGLGHGVYGNEIWGVDWRRGLLGVVEVYCDFGVRAVFGGFSRLRSEPRYLNQSISESRDARNLMDLLRHILRES